MNEQDEQEKLSLWWRFGTLLIVMVGLGVLAWLARSAYQVGPPVPAEVVGPDGKALFARQDILAGQQVFLKYGLMDNGTVWGHGAYLGPDFAAEYLHQLSLDAAEIVAREQFGKPASGLTPAQRSQVNEEVRRLLKVNRYSAAGGGVLSFTGAEAESFARQIGRWKAHFADRTKARGLTAGLIHDEAELRQLTAFFAWAAWASVAPAPGQEGSYTLNFPYDPAVGNVPPGSLVVWSALSLIALLAGTAAVLFAFGRFNYLGWKGHRQHVHPQLLPGSVTASQRASLKYFVVVAAMFLGQVLVGGAVAHYRAEPGGFYGFDLARWLPSNILRTWHLQLGIFWIATAYVGGGLFLASALGRQEPRGQVRLMNILFAALVVVVFGSMVGEWLGARGLLGKLWFWLGDQGWEYLELGRVWQVLLAGGLVLWAVLLVRAVGQARKDPHQRELSLLFLGAAFSIPLFYLPAFFFDSTSHLTVVETWRFWIIHLWVEGFFELFATVMVAVTFFKLGMVSRQTARRVIYLDAILFLGSGLIGTGHHWYWTGQGGISMALSATFSAMEVVPLILLTLDATDFVRLSRGKCDVCGQQVGFPHKWAFRFLIAVGVWNFVGAGVLGFLINLPIVSYFQAGTNLTPNHGHAALMGVFGMLAVALLVLALRQVSDEAHWRRVSWLVGLSFWGLNIGLAGMVVMNLFPSGVLQLVDVVRNGYWHARSPAFLDQPLMVRLEWLRLPTDVLFVVLGVVPLTAATLWTYLRFRHAPEISGAAG